MKKPLTLEEALEKARHYCAYQERCTSEVFTKLGQLGVGYTSQQGIVNQLEEEGYLSDERFAEIYVRSKFRQKRWGRIKIKARLTVKRLPTSLINRELNNLDQGEYENALLDILLKKKKELNLPLTQCKDKLFRFAQSRGFELGLCAELLDKMNQAD